MASVIQCVDLPSNLCVPTLLPQACSSADDTSLLPTLIHVPNSLFFFFAMLVLEFELRASHLLGRRSTTGDTLHASSLSLLIHLQAFTESTRCRTPSLRLPCKSSAPCPEERAVGVTQAVHKHEFQN
jgi:hypothetical protein